MIPKKIHYCWFGGNELSELAKKCIESWKKYCPDYEIIEWNENNFDISYCKYVEQAYETKKWAFVSDVARLYALVNYGGIYMDTDVEVLKSLDEILEYEAVSGFESKDRIPTGLMACCKDFKLFSELLDDYKKRSFINHDGELDLTTNVDTITNTCLKYGLVLNNKKQTIQGLTLFPNEYFCPKDSTTKELKITSNTYVIHHFDGSWLSDEDKCASRIREKLQIYFPKSLSRCLAKFIAIKKHRGIRMGIIETAKYFKRI